MIILMDPRCSRAVNGSLVGRALSVSVAIRLGLIIELQGLLSLSKLLFIWRFTVLRTRRAIVKGLFE